MAIKKMYIIYFMHIDFIQSSLFNHLIKLNFDSKWTLSSKMLSCILNFFFYIFKISKKCYQDFNLGVFVIGVPQKNDLYLKDYKGQLWLFDYFTLLWL